MIETRRKRGRTRTRGRHGLGAVGPSFGRCDVHGRDQRLGRPRQRRIGADARRERQLCCSTARGEADGQSKSSEHLRAFHMHEHDLRMGVPESRPVRPMPESPPVMSAVLPWSLPAGRILPGNSGGAGIFKDRPSPSLPFYSCGCEPCARAPDRYEPPG